ncbi:MAG: sensor histidine kinase [Proteobacteria bacterium]|nr:sensor histidine kinase [Verrucomicrobiota bacterium]NBU10556.1 sensor histidine kinase [Pseudomonadota bacterium]
MEAVVSLKELDLLKRQLERERLARRQAEDIAERGILRLYERQQLDRLLRTSAEASALAETPAGALRTVLDALGSYLKWPLGHAFLVTDTTAGKRLAHAQIAWGTTTADLADYDQRLRATQLQIGEGLLGRVWKNGRTIWASDCAHSHPEDPVRGSGLETVFAFPVRVQEEVVAVVALLNRAALAPDETVMDATTQIGQLLGRVFERQRSRAAQTAANELLEEKVIERTAELEAMAQKLAESARLKDEFLAAMSHELRTPLTAILGFSEVLLANTHGTLNEKQIKALTFIDEGGRHLLELINDLLDLSKINAGREALAAGWVQPMDLCGATVQLVRPLAVERKLHLELQMEENLSPVWGDERRLRQVLLNLLGNAIKFTEPGGHVKLIVNACAAKELIHLTVADTGIGIPSDFLPRLFAPFSQVDGRLARRFGGTGLGLALAHKLVLLHKGEILVTSEVGKGSTFTVVLPLKGPGGPPAVPPVSPG